YALCGDHRASTLEDRTIGHLGQAHGQTPAHVFLRWHLAQGGSAFPQSIKPDRIAQNFDFFDFGLTAEELAAIDALDTGTRGGPEPASINLATHGAEIPEA